MDKEIFEKQLDLEDREHQKSGNELIEDKERAERVEELVEKREELLSRLPTELQDRWQDAPIGDILNVIKKRESLGYKRVIGYHVSSVKLEVGDVLRPDSSGNVFYSTDLSNLYGRPAGENTETCIYIVEGTANDEVVDEELGWYTSRAKGDSSPRVVDKIKMTPNNLKMLGAGFAKCEYH